MTQTQITPYFILLSLYPIFMVGSSDFTSEINDLLKNYDQENKQELDLKRKKFSINEHYNNNRVKELLIPSATKLWYQASKKVFNSDNFVLKKKENNWELIKDGERICDDPEKIALVVNYHYNIVKDITNLLIEKTDLFNQENNNLDKTDQIILFISKIITERNSFFNHETFSEFIPSCNIPMLFHIIAKETDNNQIKCFDYFYNNQDSEKENQITGYYTMLKKVDRSTLRNFKEQFSINYLGKDGPVIYFSVFKYFKFFEDISVDTSVFKQLGSKIEKRIELCDQFHKNYHDRFSNVFINLLNQHYKKEITQPILDEKNIISDGTIEAILSEYTQNISEVIAHIKRTLLPLSSFIDVIVLPKKNDRKSPIEILNGNHTFVVSKETILFNRLYYFNAFFTAIEQMRQITDKTNIDAYSMMLKKMGQYFDQRQFDLCQELYEFFQKNHNFYSATAGNIFLTLLLFHDKFQLSNNDNTLLDYFKNNDEEITVNFDKKENGETKGYRISIKLESYFSNKINGIVRRLDYNIPVNKFLTDLFDDSFTRRYINTMPADLTVDDILNNIMTIFTNKNYPEYVNRAIIEVTKKITYKRLININTESKEVIATVYDQLEEILKSYHKKPTNDDTDNGKIFYNLLKNNSLKSFIRSGDIRKRCKKQFHVIIDNKTTKKKTKKTTAKAENNISTKKFNIPYPQINIPLLLILIYAGWHYRTKIHQTIKDFFQKKASVNL